MKELLKRAKKSQQNVADEMGKSKQEISDWFKGRFTPNPFIVKRISEILGVTMEEVTEELRKVKKSK